MSSPYSDPTIPRSRAGDRDGANAAERGRARGPAIGRLVDWGTYMVLVDHRGNKWPQDRVRWVGGAFGFGQEGLEKAPRPWRYGANGEVLVEGDELVIDFIDGNVATPIIRGGIRSTRPASVFASQPIGGDPNHLKWRLLRIDDASNAQTHFADVEIFDDPSGKLELRMGGSSVDATAVRVEIDPTLRTVKVGRGIETQRVPLGDKLLTELSKTLKELIAAGLNTVPPTPTPNTTAFDVLITAALANPADTTLLSATLKTE